MKVFLATMSLCLFAVSVYAQGGPEPADPGTTPFAWYSSIAGIVVATTFVVSLLKRVLGGVTTLNQIPTWVYAVVVSFGLTYLCVYVFGTLPGQFWQLAWQAVYNAAIASGIYEWVARPTTTLQESALKADRN